MNSKRELAEIVINRLNAGKLDKDSKITIRQAMFAVAEARNYLIQQQLFQVYSNFGIWELNFGLISEYDLPAKLDGKQWYVDMPVSPLNLVNDLGIFQVFDVDCDEDDYVPKRLGNKQLFSGLEASGMEGNKSYEPIGLRLNLFETGFTETKDNLMKIRIVANGHDLESREDFHLPAEWIDMVTDRAFQKLAPQAQIRPDYITDNISKV